MKKTTEFAPYNNENFGDKNSDKLEQHMRKNIWKNDRVSPYNYGNFGKLEQHMRKNIWKMTEFPPTTTVIWVKYEKPHEYDNLRNAQLPKSGASLNVSPLIWSKDKKWHRHGR